MEVPFVTVPSFKIGLVKKHQPKSELIKLLDYSGIVGGSVGIGFCGSIAGISVSTG